MTPLHHRRSPHGHAAPESVDSHMTAKRTGTTAVEGRSRGSVPDEAASANPSGPLCAGAIYVPADACSR
jgi:hypothetical protein